MPTIPAPQILPTASNPPSNTQSELKLTMHLSTILTNVLGFTAAVAAVDLHLHDNADCDEPGGYAAWIGVNPDVCYAYPYDAHLSASWRAIPGDWPLNAGIYKDGDCGALIASSDIFNQDTKCINGKS